MALVIKNNNVTLSEGVKLYRDALVTNGTLYLIDFSNRGTTNNFSVKNGDVVKDLSRESSETFGVFAQGTINTNKTNSELTAEKGFTAEGITGTGQYGVIIPSLMNYLSDVGVQNNNILFSIWLNTGTSGIARIFGRTLIGDSDWTNTAFRGNISATGNATITVGGAAVQDSGFFPLPNSIARCAYLYQGVGRPLKVWINGSYKGETSQLATGFNAANGKLILGKPESASNGNHTFYRFFIEDLTVSGRSAEVVVNKDYEYVNALGEYSGIEKRPFSNA